MAGSHRRWGAWDVRANGAAFLTVVGESRDRHRTGGPGSLEAGGRNWGMLQARRGAAEGRVGIRAMLSAEPWTTAHCGTISYLATGEVCDGDLVHDREPPSDLLMELAADYERPLGRGWRVQIYAGLAGEPALGPPSHAHRASATVNPLGPIGHHWLEATTAFGLVTAAVHTSRWKVEWSTFNGRAPDERRTDVDPGAFDSSSMRVTYLPSSRLALQVSGARLHEARSEFPYTLPDPFTRVTASALYSRPVGRSSLWATTLAGGWNRGAEIVPGGSFRQPTGAALVESSVLSGRHSVFGRAELAELPGHHLHVLESSTSVFVVGKLQAGYVREFNAGRGLVVGAGGTLAFSVMPATLAARYPGRVAPTFGVFLSLRGARHTMSAG